MKPFNLAVASGKGGTGKTTLSTALALAAEFPVQFLDCDVEAPNGDLFIQPEQVTQTNVHVTIPDINQELCNGCGKCSALCQFNAIVSSKKQQQAWTFPELCHSCGGCRLVCPNDAITEINHTIGEIKTGQKNHIETVQGRMNVGESMSTAMIHAVKQYTRNDRITILDCPPGITCPMIMAVKNADFTLLITEPTPFGLYDLTLAVATVKQLNIPFAVVINRHTNENNMIDSFCQQQNIDVLLRIPDKRTIAEGYALGHSILETLPELSPQLLQMLHVIEFKIREASQQ